MKNIRVFNSIQESYNQLVSLPCGLYFKSGENSDGTKEKTYVSVDVNLAVTGQTAQIIDDGNGFIKLKKI